jgi:hypothetical protein
VNLIKKRPEWGMHMLQIAIGKLKSSKARMGRPEWGMHMLQIAIGKLKSSNLNTFFSPFCTNCTIKHEFTQKKNIFQQ